MTAIRNEISDADSQEVNEIVSDRDWAEEEKDNSDAINIFADFEEGSE